MFIDLFGKKRFKLNLHTHTTNSDALKTPSEAAKIYLDGGYDAIAITDHWHFTEECEIEGLKIFSGIEYDFGWDTTEEGVYHITALFCAKDPEVTRDDTLSECIDKILAADGIPVLAHPAWSLNRPHEVEKLTKIEFTEIYNTVSGVGHSCRAYSGAFVDIMAAMGKPMLLLATDDTHYYTEDSAVASVMVSCDQLTRESVVKALKNGDFYATTGPEVHIRLENGETVINCSPAVKLELQTNAAFCKGRRLVGENITEHRVPLCKADKYIRAEVTDADGNMAFSNFVIAEREKDKKYE